MVVLQNMKRRFLDTSYALALAIPRDPDHAQAKKIALKMRKTGIGMVTTRAVLLEIGNALSRFRYRRCAMELLPSLEFDPRIEVVETTREIYQRGFELFCNRTDKEWGLVDCISNVVMAMHGLTDVLTSDDHFRQMGFNVLLNQL
jgi:predicted nucleic acid-binding protein